MARAGMAAIISTIRGMTNTSATDYEINYAQYWTDDGIQAVLDRHRTDIIHSELAVAEPQYSGGSVIYKRYITPLGNLEQTTGGTAVFMIEDLNGTPTSSANYSVDYNRGLVTFTTNQQGTAWFVTANAYNLNQTAAEIWRMKASHLAENAIQFSTDNHSINRRQALENCLTMAQMYANNDGAHTITFDRTDTNVY